MSGSVANTLWARAFVDELARMGLREVVIAPGSRSTPLVMASAADDRLQPRVHLDERSAGFFALGVGKATGRPAAVITTSGTAVANLLPAVVEASQSGVPLLVLSADRPHRLRGADANQAIDQVGIFGRFARAFYDLAPPTVDGPALRHLRSLAARAYLETLGMDAGPVHLNFPFDKPLEPASPPSDFVEEHPLAARGREGGAPFTQTLAAKATLSDVELDDVADAMDPRRGVIVAGPTERTLTVGPAVVELAAATGFPLLADPLSGARYGRAGGAHVVAAYDLFLRDVDVRERLEPTVIIRVGASPTSAALQRWLLHRNGVDQIVIDAGGRWKDHTATATRYLSADPTDTLRRLASRWSDVAASAKERADLAWAELWHRLEAATREALVEEVGGAGDGSGGVGGGDRGVPEEGRVVARVVEALPEGASLFVSSSMPIRDLDAFGHPREASLSVFANRGASGIDGVVSTAFGVASQRAAPTVCVIGDIAFFHDQNGLLWSRESDAHVVFVLIDNDGGGIFHMLPVAEHEPTFTRFFATPHGIDPAHAAAAHGLAYVEVDPSGFEDALATALESGDTAVLRVRTERVENQRRHAQVEAAVVRALRGALQPAVES